MKLLWFEFLIRKNIRKNLIKNCDFSIGNLPYKRKSIFFHKIFSFKEEKIDRTFKFFFIKNDDPKLFK